MTDFKEEALTEIKRVGAKNPITKDKLKEYGKESFTPILNLLFKYQDQLTPFFESVTKGLEAARKELQSEGGSKEDQFIGGYFSDACEWMKKASSHLGEKDLDKFNAFIKEQSDSRPGVAFGSSYLIGLVASRLIRHSLKSYKRQPGASQPEQQSTVLH